MPTDPLQERLERERKAKSSPRPRLLFIVSRDAMDHYEYLKRAFADDDNVAIVLDRRSGERRKIPSAPVAERRRAARRARPQINERLRWQGWAVVRLEPSVDTPNRMSVESVKSILVVDDDPRFASLVEDTLKGDGHRVTTARNGVEALALLADQAFDLLLVDIQMPELDGPALYRALVRRNPEHARRVMFVTGGTEGAETAELLATVRTPVLSKPVEVRELRAAVQRFFLVADGLRRRG